MDTASHPSEEEEQLHKHLNDCLQLLGMRANSGRGALHLLSRQLPSGMFDGHRSAMFAPDHLSFHGLTKRLVTGFFRLLTLSQRNRVGASLREALAWAAALTVFGFVLKRTLRRATCRQADIPAGIKTPLHRALELMNAFTALVFEAYYYPRAGLDGVAACRARSTPKKLQQKAEELFYRVRDACLRADLKALGMWSEVPNLHRLRKLVNNVIPALLHVRQAQELLFENAHQALKRAVVSGNGRDDALRAMKRYQQTDLAARRSLQHAFFWNPRRREHACSCLRVSVTCQAALESAKQRLEMPRGFA